jgi:hypothetical protein
LFYRQSIEDLANDMHFSLVTADVDRLAVLQRARGLVGYTGTEVFTNAAPAYMQWNVDHLDNWFNGGRAFTVNEGPTLPTGLYLFTVWANVTSSSAAYTRIDVGFERGGTLLARRNLSFNQKAVRLSAPVRVPAGAPQQVKVRIAMTGPTGGSTVTFTRTNAEGSPRLSWVQIATG